MKLRLLRTLVLIDWILVIGGFGLFELSSRTLPEPLRTYAVTQAETPQSPLVKALLYAGIILWCIATVGLFRGRELGRRLYLPSLLVLLAAVAIGGPKATAGWFSATEQISTAIEGAIVLLIHLRPRPEA